VPGAPTLTAPEQSYLRAVVTGFGTAQITELAAIEQVTVHDVKAVEYFLKERLASAPAILGAATVLPGVSELVHFACTSEDVNNLAYALMVRGAVREVWLAGRARCGRPGQRPGSRAPRRRDARPHARPACDADHPGQGARGARAPPGPPGPSRRAGRVPGKAQRSHRDVRRTPRRGPGADWQSVSRAFVEHLGLTWNPLTTQIESHDWQSELYSDLARFNRILHNLATDMWTYISMGVFIQVPVPGATGSSTMPHKVNPIRFENAEANLELSCALLDTLAATLVTSRLQRDLTDSTTQRNIGPAFGHSLLAIDNLRRGLGALHVDAALLARDLDANWEVLGEPVQSAMRAASVAGVTGMENPYERLKELTRGKRLTAAAMREFIDGLGLPDDVAARLAAMTPASYTGLAAELVDHLDD